MFAMVVVKRDWYVGGPDEGRDPSCGLAATLANANGNRGRNKSSKGKLDYLATMGIAKVTTEEVVDLGLGVPA
ncbi:hypothetical protein SLA2020_110420 [Shorea laevis]